MLERNRKSNSNFFDVNLPNRRSFWRKNLFSALPKRLIVFMCAIWAQTVLLSKEIIQPRDYKYRVRCDFAKEAQRRCIISNDLCRNYFRFHHCSTEVVFKYGF